MYEKGIGEALEKLIEVLQLEGHELFRIFTEVQPVIAICDAVVVLSTFIGTILGVVLIRKIEKKKKWFDGWDYEGIIITYVIMAAVCLLVSLILSATITHVFLQINYPEYYAAKELIRSLVP